MPGLRFVYLLALVVWLGGLLVLAGVAAPTTFDVLLARTPAEGRLLANAVFGTVLSRFHLVSLACGAVMLMALVVMALIGPRPRPFGPRLVVIGVMLAVTAVVVAPPGWHLEGLVSASSLPIDAWPGDGLRGTGLEHVQRLSGGLLMLNAVAGLLLLFWDARERRS